MTTRQEALLEAVAGIAISILGNWLAMLSIGWAHSTDDRIPALGFWTVLWLTFALGCALMAARLADRFWMKRNLCTT